MLKYILKRLLLIIPTLLGVLFIVFAIMNFTPGDPGRQILGISAKQETVDELNHQLGYDRPFLVRFVSYIGDLLQGGSGNLLPNKTAFYRRVFHQSACYAEAWLPFLSCLFHCGDISGDFVGGEAVFLCGYLQYDNSHPVCVHPRFFPGNGADICVWPEAGASAYPWDCRMEKLHPACADAGGRGAAPS